MLRACCLFKTELSNIVLIFQYCIFNKRDLILANKDNESHSQLAHLTRVFEICLRSLRIFVE